MSNRWETSINEELSPLRCRDIQGLKYLDKLLLLLDQLHEAPLTPASLVNATASHYNQYPSRRIMPNRRGMSPFSMRYAHSKEKP